MTLHAIAILSTQQTAHFQTTLGLMLMNVLSARMALMQDSEQS